MMNILRFFTFAWATTLLLVTNCEGTLQQDDGALAVAGLESDDSAAAAAASHKTHHDQQEDHGNDVPKSRNVKEVREFIGGKNEDEADIVHGLRGGGGTSRDLKSNTDGKSRYVGGGDHNKGGSYPWDEGGYGSVARDGLKEINPCKQWAAISPNQYNHEWTDSRCAAPGTDNCSGGCCRAYNWLRCDTSNAFPTLPCICNSLTQNANANTFVSQPTAYTYAIPLATPNGVVYSPGWTHDYNHHSKQVDRNNNNNNAPGQAPASTASRKKNDKGMR